MLGQIVQLATYVVHSGEHGEPASLQPFVVVTRSESVRGHLGTPCAKAHQV
jgi:hypothetical protein